MAVTVTENTGNSATIALTNADGDEIGFVFIIQSPREELLVNVLHYQATIKHNGVEISCDQR